jgi:hypothetical protein
MGIFDVVLEEEKRIPAGLNEAVVYGVIALGTQVSDFNGHVKEGIQIALLFETEEGKTNQTYNIPMSYSKKSSLIKAIEAINGKPFNKEPLKTALEGLLGKICQIDIEEKVSQSNGKTYSNIKNVVGAPKKPSIEGKETHIWFDFSEKEVPEGIPKYLLENKIMKSPEYIKKYTVTEVLDI